MTCCGRSRTLPISEGLALDHLSGRERARADKGLDNDF
jgi:hypothetical protein